MTSHNKLQTNLGVCAGSPFGSLWQKLYGTGGFAAWSEREWEDISKLRPNVQCNDSRLHRKCQLIIQLYWHMQHFKTNFNQQIHNSLQLSCAITGNIQVSGFNSVSCDGWMYDQRAKCHCSQRNMTRWSKYEVHQHRKKWRIQAIFWWHTCQQRITHWLRDSHYTDTQTSNDVAKYVLAKLQKNKFHVRLQT